MNNYANDNGTGLEQQVIIIWRLPDTILVQKCVNEIFIPTGSAMRKKNQIWQHKAQNL